MLSNFSCVYQSSICFLWKNVDLGHLSFFWLACVFWSWHRAALAVWTFERLFPCWLLHWQLFYPILWVVFSFLIDCLLWDISCLYFLALSTWANCLTFLYLRFIIYKYSTNTDSETVQLYVNQWYVRLWVIIVMGSSLCFWEVPLLLVRCTSK